MHSKWTKLAALLWVLVIFFTGCGGAAGPPSRIALVVGPSSSGDPSAPRDYATMCHHYCHVFEQTRFYDCMQSGSSSDACVDKVTFYEDQCYQLRCVPQLVSPKNCLDQCDGLAIFYGQVCPQSATDIDLCPLIPALHDQDCREGCVVDAS